jgi:c-di-GMP-related signal transduction protein
MSIIFVVPSQMSPTLEFEYRECEARVVFSSMGDMSENTTKIVYLTLTKSGIRGTIQRTKFIINFPDNHH